MLRPETRGKEQGIKPEGATGRCLLTERAVLWNKESGDPGTARAAHVYITVTSVCHQLAVNSHIWIGDPAEVRGEVIRQSLPSSR